MSNDALRAMFPTGFGSSKKVESTGAIQKPDISVQTYRGPLTEDASESSAGVSSASSFVASDSPKKSPLRGSFESTMSEENPIVKESKTFEATENPTFGPARPETNVDGEFDEEELKESIERLPLSLETDLRGHTKACTSLALDRTGSRLASAGSDYQVFLWHFSGMDDQRQHFKTFEPWEGHKINSVQWSITGDRLLVATGNPIARVFDRDGNQMHSFVKGDQYLRDLSNTKGHIGSLCNACWHPTNPARFLTGSIDSTVRVWDVTDTEKQLSIIKIRHIKTGRRVAACHCVYNHSGSGICVAGADGSLQVWAARAPFNRPQMIVRSAHVPESETSCIVFDQADTLVATRGGDDTLKVWDLRQFSRPLGVVDGLPNLSAQTSAVFSPDEDFIATGTSIKAGGGRGKLVLVNTKTLKPSIATDVTDTSVISIEWHPLLNQIFLGCGDGRIHVFYSSQYSSKGIIPVVGRHYKRRSNEVVLPSFGKIVNPHALPMYREQFQNKKRKLEKDRLSDPLKTQKPEQELTGPGKGGKLGTSYSAHLMARFMTMKTNRTQDPREAFLKHEKEAEKMPVFAPGYEHKVFAEDVPDEEENEESELYQEQLRLQRERGR